MGEGDAGKSNCAWCDWQVYLNMGNMTPSVVSGEESAGVVSIPQEQSGTSLSLTLTSIRCCHSVLSPEGHCTGTGHQSVDSSCEDGT